MRSTTDFRRNAYFGRECIKILIGHSRYANGTYLVAIAGMAGSIILAGLSYELIEKRILHLKRYFTAIPKAARPAVVGI